MSWKVSNIKEIPLLPSLIFIGYLVVFSVLDYLNLPYTLMKEEYGIYLVVINITLNFLMALLSAYLMYLNQGLIKKTGLESKGENLSLIAIIFGMLTYGCTPCVIAFFASIGISLSVAILPLAGLPYKFISLGLILIGLLWLKHDLKKTTCQL